MDNPGFRFHLVAKSAADCRDTMIEGESGILACSPPGFRPEYSPTKRRLTWPNGAMAVHYSSEEPDALRGPQCHGWWADEVASWKYPTETWDMLSFGARLGSHVQGVITTTPKPIPLIKSLCKQATPHGPVRLTRGSTYDNRANLAPTFYKRIVEEYEGTRLGRQEIHGEILDDNPNALWTREMIDENRIQRVDMTSIVQVITAVDPAATSNKESDDTGIVTGGRDRRSPRHYYVLADNTQKAARPEKWARVACRSFDRWSANIMVAEKNNGGEMVEHTIHTVDPSIPVRLVTASRAKHTRAEPVSSLYEQGRVHHVGSFPDLEDQMCEWEPGDDSPDRMDALVWLISALKSAGGGLRTGLDVKPR
jgi:phage terminase large subunit-like protein